MLVGGVVFMLESLPGANCAESKCWNSKQNGEKLFTTSPATHTPRYRFVVLFHGADGFQFARAAPGAAGALNGHDRDGAGGVAGMA